MTESHMVGQAQNDGAVEMHHPRKRVKTMSLNLDGTWEEDDIDSEEAEELGIQKGKDSDSEEDFTPWAWTKPQETPPKVVPKAASESTPRLNVDTNDWSSTNGVNAKSEKLPNAETGDWNNNGWSSQKPDSWNNDWASPAQPTAQWNDWGPPVAARASTPDVQQIPSELQVTPPQMTPPPLAPQQQSAPILELPPDASRCIILFPMFNAATVDLVSNPTFFNDVHGDVQRECQNFGPVLQVWINPSSQGDVWVHFAELEPAARCQMALNKRWFGGQQITVEFSSEENWKRNVVDTMTHALD
mmetsp:Transcript_102361/g.159673  ORF Transcript_102361/g.159673 Transcript_102361/m.159673 type:complete len:301 (-) Transcript_102361:81-983(-)